MNQEPRTGNLIDTTDCLEAVSVIRCWKNFLFVIVLLCLLLLQGLFWMMNLKLVRADEAGRPAGLLGLAVEGSAPAVPASGDETAEDKIKQAAKEIAGDANAATAAGGRQQDAAVQTPQMQTQQLPAEPNLPQQTPIGFWFELKVKHVAAMVRFLDFVLIPGAALYCLTMLLSLKVSLIGRLGGIRHIARAFFVSLVFVILLLPWQLLFAPVFAGAMFTPAELIAACKVPKTSLAFVLSFYLRFVGYWLLVLLLLLTAQIRSMRWAKMTLRRLEVI